MCAALTIQPCYRLRNPASRSQAARRWSGWWRRTWHSARIDVRFRIGPERAPCSRRDCVMSRTISRRGAEAEFRIGRGLPFPGRLAAKKCSALSARDMLADAVRPAAKSCIAVRVTVPPLRIFASALPVRVCSSMRDSAAADRRPVPPPRRTQSAVHDYSITWKWMRIFAVGLRGRGLGPRPGRERFRTPALEVGVLSSPGTTHHGWNPHPTARPLISLSWRPPEALFSLRLDPASTAASQREPGPSPEHASPTPKAVGHGVTPTRRANRPRNVGPPPKPSATTSASEPPTRTGA